MRKAAYAPSGSPKPSVLGARFLRLLADETRLRILALLMRTPDLCVCELVAILRLPQYQISRHLGQLRRHDLLTSRREGPFVFYGISDRARRDRVQVSILHSIPELVEREAAARDLGHMRRLMKLEGGRRVQTCEASTGPQAIRRRPILRMLSQG